MHACVTTISLPESNAVMALHLGVLALAEIDDAGD